MIEVFKGAGILIYPLVFCSAGAVFIICERAYALRNKSVTPDGKSARLLVSGPGELQEGDKPETIYGTVRMVMEGGAWKVGDTEWTNNPRIVSGQ